MANQASILGGVRVVDLTQALAGPYCTQLLGDMGADVVKIERPGGGDQARGWGPPFVGDESTYFMGTNRNKRSITLDLQTNGGKDVLDRLLASADVLVHNTPKESVRKKLGIDSDRVMSKFPHIIWTSITGFGLSGPEAEKPGYDVIAQGMSGTMALTGEANSGPMRFPTPMADITTGMYAAMAILGALYEREKSGEGQIIDLALLDSQTTWLANVASAYFATGTPPAKRGNAHPNIAPYQPFPAQDGWFILAAGTERHWERLLEIVDKNGQLAQDSRFSSNRDRVANRDALDAALTEIFSQQSVSFWIEQLESVGIPCGPIHKPEEILEHPQIKARDMVWSFEHVSAGQVRSLGNPMKFSRTPAAPHSPAPSLGQHTRALLGELGFNDEEIEQLKAESVV
jgi:crotonobetainyl-CoA:carnitine CoA-transferase CaiB-like acyl-CoA transferase